MQGTPSQHLCDGKSPKGKEHHYRNPAKYMQMKSMSWVLLTPSSLLFWRPLPISSLFFASPTLPRRLSRYHAFSKLLKPSFPGWDKLVIILIKCPSRFLQLSLDSKQLLHTTELDGISPKGKTKVIDLDFLAARVHCTLRSAVTCFDYEISYYFIENAQRFGKWFLRKGRMRCWVTICVQKVSYCVQSASVTKLK